ncbi:hypothetical protein F4779DRAFT_618829 [Xylariaceae sp. FL0662B]|nr:hypothetical protein F4779DRAFT_618829 [Xylariaceae sp. FL0662B]
MQALFAYYVKDFMVKRLLNSPSFHRAVRRVHQTIQDYKYGRDPHEPLRPGEATREPGFGLRDFLSHFTSEIRNEFRRTIKKPMPPSSTTRPSTSKSKSKTP